LVFDSLKKQFNYSITYLFQDHFLILKQIIEFHKDNIDDLPDFFLSVLSGEVIYNFNDINGQIILYYLQFVAMSPSFNQTKPKEKKIMEFFFSILWRRVVSKMLRKLNYRVKKYSCQLALITRQEKSIGGDTVLYVN
jgi:hypothetical protein